ncbi:MAG: hypothetical protein RIS60_1344 [Pseudomonadota bacterium]
MSQFDHFVGTRPVTGTHAFDVQALEAWLHAHMPGFKGPLSVEMFKGGQSNPTYKLITPACSYVMRAKPGPVAKLLPSAHAIERLQKCMSCAKTKPSSAEPFTSWNLWRAAFCGTSLCPT